MNNPEDMPIDEEEMRAWFLERKATGLSWKAIADESGIAQGTASTWATGNYQGNGQNIAKKVYRYRQTLETQADRAATVQDAGLAKAPYFVETKTSRYLTGLIITAHAGGVTYAATGPGLGKSRTARNYCASAVNAFMVTMNEALDTTTALLGEILRVLGNKQSGSPWQRQMYAQVRDMMVGRRSMLIIDEANKCSLKMLEMLRALNDNEDMPGGPGICLLGNEELHKTIMSGAGTGRHQFGRLKRRIDRSHLQDMPFDEDIEIYLDAWDIHDREQRALLKRVGLTPGTGGLGELKQIISNASLLAFEDGQALSHGHLREAIAQRATVFLRNSH